MWAQPEKQLRTCWLLVSCLEADMYRYVGANIPYSGQLRASSSATWTGARMLSHRQAATGHCLAALLGVRHQGRGAPAQPATLPEQVPTSSVSVTRRGCLLVLTFASATTHVRAGGPCQGPALTTKRQCIVDSWSRHLPHIICQVQGELRLRYRAVSGLKG